MVLASVQTVTGTKTFGSAGAVGKLAIAGTTSGSTVLDATAAASGTLTLPAATDTLVGKATTDTLTNKTLTSPIIKGEAVVALTDAATIATNAALGNVFTVSVAVNRTYGAPSNPTSGQKCIWRWTNSDSVSHTMTFTTGSAGAFRFGTTVSGVSATTAGKTDYVGAVYNVTDDRWDVIAYAKGY